MTPLLTKVTFPILLGNSPTMSAGPTVRCVNVETGAVIVNGAPEVTLKMEPTCQRSTSLDTHEGAFLRKVRLGPKGNSNVPLLRRLCVRWKPSKALFADRSRGFR